MASYDPTCGQQWQDYYDCETSIVEYQSCSQEWDDYNSEYSQYESKMEVYYDTGGSVYSGYWWDVNSNNYFSRYTGTPNPYVFDNNSSLYTYINNYESYLFYIFFVFSAVVFT